MKTREYSRSRVSSKCGLLLRGLASAAGIVGIAFLAYYIVSALSPAPAQPREARGDLSQRFAREPALVYGGVPYALRKDVTTILFLGIDQRHEGGPKVAARSGGQADFVTLLILDAGAKTRALLPIDRDTIVEATVLGVLGNAVGTKPMQLALSHGFGDGREQSCGYTVEAVSRLLGGVAIDHYVAMDLDGILALNGALGGVTVTIEDDLRKYDPAMAPGATVTLTQGQAEIFVRARIDVGDGTNEQRMRRQRAFLDEAMRIMERGVAKDANYTVELFDAVSPYLVTDMSRGRIINEAYKARGYAAGAPLSIAGTHAIGKDGFMEFRADERQLMDLVVGTFYAPMPESLNRLAAS